MMKQISIWLRDDVPSELSDIIPGFFSEDEFVAVVAHVPNHVLEDRLYEQTKLMTTYPPNAGRDPRMRWFSETGVGLFGSNAIDFIEHPNGDGHIVVCRFI